MLKIRKQSKEKWMEPDLIHAAQYNDFDEARNALQNPGSILQTNHLNMNALQVAISEQHEDMAIYLIEESKISARHKDVHKRDALKIAMHLGTDTLISKVNERWNDEFRSALQNKREVSKLPPPKP